MNKLSSTSALVLLWSKGEIHTSPLSLNYFQLLNLDEGKPLLSKCNLVWPNYSEVIKNRKKCVLDLVFSSMKKDKIKQIIILGAGMDPLSLEILSQNPKVKIFEIDFSLDNKRKILLKIDKKLKDSLTLITGDLTKPKTIATNLKNLGWNQNLTTLIVAEGMSYYLTEEALWNIFKIFTTKPQKNQLILEYLIPDELISRKNSFIPREVFKIISNEMELSFITKYDIKKITRKLKPLGGKIIRSYTMRDMEKSRTGKNHHFRFNKNGWIEICHCRI